MNSKEIMEEIMGLGNVYVVPRNKLPSKVKIPSGFVINTDSDQEQGEHWVAIFIGKDQVPIYFDSFGLPPLHEDFHMFLNRTGRQGWIYNTVTLQHPTSTSCGKYCIEFLRHQFKYKSVFEFINLFTSDLIRNEKILNSLRTRRKL